MHRNDKHIKSSLKVITFIAVLGLFLLQSCDPARIMVVKTSEKSNYSVTVYANEKIFPRSYPYHQDSIEKKIIIHVPTTDTIPQREKIFFYGLGGWSDSYLMPDFSKNIDSIIIVNGKGKMTLNSQSSINDFLLKHRHGFAKRILTIEAK